MKKSIITLSILSSFAGMAQAASSVTLYGRVEVGYRDLAGGGDFKTTNSTGNTASAVKLLKKSIEQTAPLGAHFGFKGEEDLGNGLSATFRLESSLFADTGSVNSSRLFERESTVGLKGKFGEIRVGRSISAFEQSLSFQVNAHGPGDVLLYSSVSPRHSNALFYNYNYSNPSFGNISFGADVTTKGGASGDTLEGTKGTDVAYAARINYAGHGFVTRIAYQNDGDVAASGTTPKYHQREFGGLLSYNFKDAFQVPLQVGVAYAKGEGQSHTFFSALGLSSTIDKGPAKNAQTLTGFIRGWFTPMDTAYLQFQRRTADTLAGVEKTNGYMIGGGYEHKLSNRTMLFADAVYVKQKKFNAEKVDGKLYGGSVGLRHTF